MSDGFEQQSGFDEIDDEAFVEGLINGGAEFFFDLLLDPWYRFWSSQPIPSSQVDDSVALAHFVRDGFGRLDGLLGRLHPIAARNAAHALFRNSWVSVDLDLDVARLHCEPSSIQSLFVGLKQVGDIQIEARVQLSSKQVSRGPRRNFSGELLCTAQVSPREGSVGSVDTELDRLNELAREPSARILPDFSHDTDVSHISAAELSERDFDALIESLRTPFLGPQSMHLAENTALSQVHWTDSIDHLSNNLRLDGFSVYTGNPEHAALGGPFPPPPTPGSRNTQGEPNWVCLELVTRQLKMLEALESKLSEGLRPSNFSDAWIDAFKGFAPPSVQIEFSDRADPDGEAVADFTIMHHSQHGDAERIALMAELPEDPGGTYSHSDEIFRLEVLNGWTADGTERSDNPRYQLVMKFWHDKYGTVTVTTSVGSEHRVGPFGSVGSQSVTVLLPLTSEAWASLILQSLAQSHVTHPTFRRWEPEVDAALSEADRQIGGTALGWDSSEASQ